MWLFGNRKSEPSAVELIPYVLRLREGFLVGVAHSPQQASPCVSCIQKWLLDRQIYSTPLDPNEWSIRPDLLQRIREEGNPHVCYEIGKDGSETRLDNCVLPHPTCDCAKASFQLPKDFSWNLSFAFSPLTQIKCVRYTTPSGHLWLTSVFGKAVQSGQAIRVYGSGTSKEESRRRAISEWFKRASLSDFNFMHHPKQPIVAESLQTLTSTQIRLDDPYLVGLGAGTDYVDATLNSLFDLVKKRTLQRYASTLKNPILVVGTHAWLRSRMPFFMLQEYDWYILFYPNSSPCWVVGLAGFSRLQSEAKPIFVFDAHSSMAEALNGVVGKALEACRPDFDTAGGNAVAPISDAENAEKLRQKNLWWTHWIYRCSKLNLKEIEAMEPYAQDLELWRSYFRDGQPSVSLMPGNTPEYPLALMAVLHTRLHEVRPATAKVYGIGTTKDFQASWNS